LVDRKGGRKFIDMKTIKINSFCTLLAAVLMVSIGSSCNTIEYVNRFYQVTRCADPWHQEDATAQEYRDNAVEYLTAAGYDVKGPISTTDGDTDEEDCLTCQCKTNERLRLDVHRDDVTDLETLFGFTKD